ncbi:MAG TPA: twin-arginine translocase TatA/TatE family subunit [Acidimicrobiales bacterium]|jgi:sec-independent protein translocase protein TatB|nr:twin-arginine translocase TatA/TatE family subunit [Acidimicrobiales bacterium]
MLNLDPAKLLIIAVVAVILLGPDKLPQFARQVGGAWRSFNEFRHRMETEVRSSIPDLPSSTDIARLARSPSALLNHLSNMGTDGDALASTPPLASDDGSGSGSGDESESESELQAAPVAPLPRPENNNNSNHVSPPPTASTGTTATPAGAESTEVAEVVVPGDPSLN